MSELPALEQKLPALVDQCAPRRLVAIGPLAARLVERGLPVDTKLHTLPTREAVAALGDLGHQDMAIVAGDLERLSPKASAQLIARLRDIYAAWVIVVVDRDEPPAGWTRREMIGFGFSLLGDAVQESTPVHVYEFDVGTYKPTPDWLNSRYWANPELWDKYRW